MPEQIENHMTADWYWNEKEYGLPDANRMRRVREACEEAEREDKNCEYTV